MWHVNLEFVNIEKSSSINCCLSYRYVSHGIGGRAEAELNTTSTTLKMVISVTNSGCLAQY